MKQKLYLIIAGLLMLAIQLKAQAPNSLNYQGVARDITGAVLDKQTINLRFSVHQGSASGTVVYQETQLETTNEFGLFTCAIGTGSVILGNFSTINWGADAFYLQVEMDPAGGSNFFNMGTNQMLSVPYALYAASAGNSGSTYTSGSGINITGTVISAQAANPLWNADKLQGDSISTVAPTNGQVLEWNGTTWAPATISVGISGWGLTGNSGTTSGTNFIGTTDAQDLVFKTSSNENMRIANSNGNVGIGTNAPAQKLHVVDVNNSSSDFGGYNFQIEVESQSGTNAGIYLNGSSSNNSLAGIVDRGNGTAFYEGLNNNSDYRIAGVEGIDAGDLTNAKDGTAGITVSNSSGNVGIGTNSPAQALDVESGNVQFAQALMPNGDPGAAGEVLQSNGANTAPTWVVSGSGGGGWALNGNSGTTYGTNFIGTTDDNGLQFEVNNNEAGLIEDYDGGQGGNGNTGLGYQSLNSNYSNGGYENTATGYNAMYSNNYGNDNDADGYQALYSNYSGYYNVAIGSQAMYYNQYGIQNTAIGQQALYNNDNTGDNQGWYNVAIGSQAMQANTDGQWNACVGTVGMLNNTTGTKNTGMGSPTMYNNTTGSYNVALGTNALNTNQTGNNLTALGYLADVTTDGLTNSTVIGNGAVVSTSNTMVLGNNSVVELDFNGSLTPWNGSSYDPGQAGYVLQSNGAGTPPSWVPAGGGGSGWGLTGNSGTTYGTNFIGTTDDEGLLFEVDGTPAGHLEGDFNNGSNQTTAFGVGALQNNNAGYNDVAIGYQAMNGGGNDNSQFHQNTAVGDFAMQFGNGGNEYVNTAIGFQALQNNSGNFNTAIGGNALMANTSGTKNVALGECMENNMTGSFNVGAGQDALYSNIDGNYNTAVGVQAGNQASDANDNTAVGYNTLPTNNTGSDITAIGFQADVSTDGLSNATAIGSGAIVSASNTVQLGNGCSVQFDQALMPGGDPGTAGYLLQSNGAGSAPTWVTIPGSGWALTGNSGTTAGTNFIGTTDPTDFVIKTNGNERVRVTSGGSVGVGTSTPAVDAGIALGAGHIETQGGAFAASVSINPINIGIGGAGGFNPTVGGTDVGGAVFITTGVVAVGSGQMITVNFGTPYTNPPAVVITPADATTAAAMVNQQPYVVSSQTGFDIDFVNTGGANTTYNFNYFVIEAK